MSPTEAFKTLFLWPSTSSLPNLNCCVVWCDCGWSLLLSVWIQCHLHTQAFCARSERSLLCSSLPHFDTRASSVHSLDICKLDAGSVSLFRHTARSLLYSICFVNAWEHMVGSCDSVSFQFSPLSMQWGLWSEEYSTSTHGSVMRLMGGSWSPAKRFSLWGPGMLWISYSCSALCSDTDGNPAWALKSFCFTFIYPALCV